MMKRLYRNFVTMGMRLAKPALSMMMACGVLATQAQTEATTINKEFTACALNIDGLPQTMAGITVNADGPGSEGTQAIGNYLVDKGVDMVGISEDFNYNGDLIVGLGENYQMGAWRGRIDASGILSGHFNTDGLMFLLKNQNKYSQTMSFTNESWTKWNESLGGLNDGANTLIDKGFRFYTVNLGDNVKVDVYVLHMNTAENADQIAVQDKQLTQLAEAIKGNSDGRPKLILGDTNCRYTRNKLVENLITPLSATYDIKDAWVEKFKNGTYPTYNSEALMVSDKTSSKAYETGEIVDKIFYLTPKGSSLKLELKDLVFDADNYKKTDGTLLGDHVPVIATFAISGTLPTENLTPATQAAFWEGETLEKAKSETTGDATGVYIYNVGARTFITGEADAKPSVTDVNSAEKWEVNNGNTTGTTTFAKGNYRIRMSNSLDGGVGIIEKTYRGATEFTIVESTTTSGAYKFDAEYLTLGEIKKTNHHFNVEVDANGNPTSYTGAKNNSLTIYNDWLFISEAQRTAYNTYVEAYEAAKNLLNDGDCKDYFEKVPEMKAELEQILLETTNTVYSTSETDTEKLKDIVDRIKNRKSYIATVTTAAKYATICLPYNAWIPEGVEVQVVTGYSEDGHTAITAAYNGEVMPANTGFLLHANVKTDTEFTFWYTGKKADAPEANILLGTVERIAPENRPTQDVYVLANRNHGVGFYRLNDGQGIPANRAYLVGNGNTPTDTEAKIAIGWGDATGVDNVETAGEAATVTAVYGIAGERRARMERGVNIVRMSDGTTRKVIVK